MQKIIFAMTICVGMLSGISQGQSTSWNQSVSPWQQSSSPWSPTVNIDSPGQLFFSKAIINKTQISPGGTITVAVEMNIGKGWVYYAPNQTEDFIVPAGYKVTARNIKVVDAKWQTPVIKSTDLGDRITDIPVYKKQAWLFVTLKASKKILAGDYSISITPTGQMCKDVCQDIPSQTVTVKYKVVKAVNSALTTIANPQWTKVIAERFANAKTLAELKESQSGPTQIISQYASWSLAWATLIAFIAGLTLNIMPCVLPVIPLRILTVVQMAGESKRKYITMGLAFAAGILLFFLIIAAINVILKLTVGRAIDINEGFQHSGVIIALSGVLVVLCGNLFGLFDVTAPQGAGKWESKVDSGKAGHVKSLGMGFMLAILATPCSFAFLAAALAYAQTATVINGTLIIVVIGLAMALPHVLLAVFPKLIDFLPKPGRWMELFRQGCGFALLGAVVWLVSTLGGDGSGWAFRVVGWFVVLSAGVWMWGKWVGYGSTFRKKIIVRLAAVILVVFSGFYLLAKDQVSKLHYQPFELEMINKYRQQGDTVIVKFTAKWCLECLKLDRTVYNDSEVAAAIKSDENIKLFKGDITQSDTPAAKWMKANGYGSRIPLTIIYRSGKQPLVVVGGYSPEEFLKWIKQ